MDTNEPNYEGPDAMDTQSSTGQNNQQSQEIAPMPVQRGTRTNILDRAFTPEQEERMRNMNRQELAIFINSFQRGNSG